jgi:hypothetical protein
MLVASTSLAQGTALTYQGKLTAAGSPANGNYDMQFKLYDTQIVGTGTQQGATMTNPTVAVSSGSFTVQLDFGASVFTGAPRYLEIGVRTAGDSNPYTVLSPRAEISSTPYATRSLSATTADTAADAGKLGGIPPSGFIQNGTTQQTADFNISGNGTLGGNLTVGGTFSLNIINATTQFNLGGNRILSVAGGSNNTFLGINAGAAGPAGGSNTFVGFSAGRDNTSGFANSFFGDSAGPARPTPFSDKPQGRTTRRLMIILSSA